MTEYPGAIYSPRTKENKAGITYDAAKTTIGYAEDITKLDDEVIAIETELGLNPKGSSADITERIKGIKSLSNANSDVLIIKIDRVGIGTNDPTTFLDIEKASTRNFMRFEETAGNHGRFFIYTKGGDNYYGDPEIIFNTQGDTNYWSIGIDNSRPSPAANSGVFKITSGGVGVSGGANAIAVAINGEVGIGTDVPTAKLDINSDILRLRTAKTPASAGAAGNAGDVCWDSNYIYICIATNSWKRVAISAW